MRRYTAPYLSLVRRWPWKDTEESNFYYDLTAINRAHLAHFVALVTGKTFEAASGYIEELRADAALKTHLERNLPVHYPQRGITVEYGRRMGWYAIARAVKPRIIVETGVDHGVGACVLAAALLRNHEEGSPGRYFGLDINPLAGALLKERYAAVGELLFGDSIATLGAFPHKISLFINDSDHTGDFEAREYRSAAGTLTADAIVLSDNSHVTHALAYFAQATGRRFLYFREDPLDHWYPGAGIGAAF